MNLSGVLVVDKPTGMTSHDVIDRLRKILHTRKIGHAGTLDPSAGGVLVACVDQATKIAGFLTEYDKEYRGVIQLGIATDTYDGEGKITRTEKDLKISSDEIKRTVLSFKGKIKQTPPMYSAIKYQGKKLYQYARGNQEVKINKREVEIKDIEILEIDIPYIKLRISCSKGTYVRSLAHDVGEKLGCGAYLHSLRRTRVGPFRLEEALSLEKIADAQGEGKISDVLVPIKKALAHLPSVVTNEWFASRVQHGIPLEPKSVLSVEGDFDSSKTITVKNEQGEIIALGRALTFAKNFLDHKYENKLFEYLRVI
jgi:tRNA pseudouridine55 synthase